VSNTFNHAASTSFKTVSTQTENLAYGSANVYGFTGTDDVYLSSTGTPMITNMEFFLITSQTGIDSSFDGIAGMGRPV